MVNIFLSWQRGWIVHISDTCIPDVKLLQPRLFQDERGYFFESFNKQQFDEAIGRKIAFVQDNQSRSRKGTIRGFHYQIHPHAQGKLVRVLLGEVLDVALDIRKSSPTFGECVCEVLSAENKRQLWIPEGFAHGFLTLSETAEILYKVNNFYSPIHERCIDWNDPAINIQYDKDQSLFRSFKDTQCPSLAESEVFS